MYTLTFFRGALWWTPFCGGTDTDSGVGGSLMRLQDMTFADKPAIV